MKLDNKAKNIDLLQEECAELIQALSKIRRFGLEYMNPKDNVTNRQALIQELADVKVLMDAVERDYCIHPIEIDRAKDNKVEKLKTWYNKKSS